MNPEYAQAESSGARRWMIVDDNEDILVLLRFVVAQLNDIGVECFQSPREALAAFIATPGTFELVITDLEMPGMDGLELSRRLRRFAPSLKILLSTGSEIISDEEAVEKGFCGLLRKPFPLVAFKRAIEAAGLGKSISNSTVCRRELVAT